jgi:hypothetical protein
MAIVVNDGSVVKAVALERFLGWPRRIQPDLLEDMKGGGGKL